MKVKNNVSRISEKGQVTIPKKVRESLHAEPGDFLEYEVQGNVVMIRRVEPLDHLFHDGLSGGLTEWSSPEDDNAFRDL
jgi:antitoxin PrlF